jgi:hypothetical protein
MLFDIRPTQYLYPSIEAACAHLEVPLKPGWNVDEKRTYLVRLDDKDRVCIDSYDDPDFRQSLKDLLDLDYHIIAG